MKFNYKVKFLEEGFGTDFSNATGLVFTQKINAGMKASFKAFQRSGSLHPTHRYRGGRFNILRIIHSMNTVKKQTETQNDYKIALFSHFTE